LSLLGSNVIWGSLTYVWLGVNKSHFTFHWVVNVFVLPNISKSNIR